MDLFRQNVLLSFQLLDLLFEGGDGRGVAGLHDEIQDRIELGLGRLQLVFEPFLRFTAFCEVQFPGIAEHGPRGVEQAR
ncbi:hypothetical protein [Pontivivens ytuae]|uniref:hypothetical protein n=1 Tax=Pontivivens ytuae TaxID=2789856 RepID=UPI001E3AFA8E|nr:hypothetical protein [Pontivivens ytuae]